MGIENDHQKWKIPTVVPLKPTSWLGRIPIESEISVGGYHQPSSTACAVTGISKKGQWKIHSARDNPEMLDEFLYLRFLGAFHPVGLMDT